MAGGPISGGGKEPKFPGKALGGEAGRVDVGSGSRPTRSRYPIETSMDGVDPKTLGRDVPGSLK